MRDVDLRGALRHLVGWCSSPDAKAKGGRGQQASRGHRPRWPSRPNESRSALISRAPYDYPDWGFPWFSLLEILAAVFCIHYCFHCCICSVNKHRYLLDPGPICYSNFKHDQSGFESQKAFQPNLYPL